MKIFKKLILLQCQDLYLHPEESLLIGRLEFQKKNSASGTLGYPNIFTIIRENDPILRKEKNVKEFFMRGKKLNIHLQHSQIGDLSSKNELESHLIDEYKQGLSSCQDAPCFLSSSFCRPEIPPDFYSDYETMSY